MPPCSLLDDLLSGPVRDSGPCSATIVVGITTGLIIIFGGIGIRVADTGIPASNVRKYWHVASSCF